MICPKCKGKGEVKSTFIPRKPMQFYTFYERDIKCSYCDGIGEINKFKHILRRIIKAVKED